ncbi:amino acid adenylation domain-containing protein, partial [Streptomyces bobili]|uniref:amino acid adenylation domain-containing protein n=1 Tax=Streptomyces bobili TaxID=67280 RepID=UPI00366531F7
MSERRGPGRELSTAQSGVWFGHKLDATGHAYNVGAFVELHGELDLPLFIQAFRHAFDETESLRVAFEERDGTVLQWVTDSAQPHLIVHDFCGEPDGEAKAVDWIKHEFHHPVDIAGQHLHTFALFKISNNYHLWYARSHHIVTDSYASVIFQDRISDIYADLKSGTPYVAKTLGSFHGVLDEELEYRASRQFSIDRDYWLNTFSTPAEPVTLSDRIARSSGDFTRLTTPLSDDDSARLLAAARSGRTAWSVVAIAAVAAFLHRTTGRQDVTLGLPIMGRKSATNQATPASTSDVLPLHIEVRPDDTLQSLLRKTTHEVKAALRHQRYRSEDLGRELRARGVHHPLWSVSANILSFDGEPSFGDVQTVTHNLSNGPVRDLCVVVRGAADASGLTVDFDGNTELYDSADLRRHLNGFVRLLTALTAEPATPLGHFDLMEDAEVHKVLIDWNDPGSALDLADGLLPELFEAQTVTRPDAIAVTFQDEELSYRELNDRANRLARHLIDHGAGPEQLVALALPRSADLIVALLAVLKSGAGYVPIDPGYPADRIAYMLQDSAPVLLLSDTNTAAVLPAPADGPATVLLDDPHTTSAVAARPGHNVTDVDRCSPLSPQNTAYIIYTSGSTGRPKGVIVPHANVVRLFASTAKWFRFTATDVWTLFHSYAFDFSVWEVWGPLLHGGRLVVVTHEHSRSPEAMLRLIADHGVTVLNQTPSAFYQLMQAEAQAGSHGWAASLRFVVFGGEALDARRLTAWYQHHPADAPQLVNMYGITETTVHVTYAELGRSLPEQEVGLIGQQIPDLRVYVLDAALRPAPVGAAGELYVSGSGLARGYLGQPALTAQRFTADPYGPAGSRMYRTGDLARWRADGVLEFVGRADAQVKVRGFRIELGEIETVLAAHPEVAQATVTVWEERPGDQRLVAYVVPQDPAAGIDVSALRGRLADLLPDYMVPTTYTVLDALPLTPNGKLDRRALPAPDYAAASTGRAPRTERERVLCGLFAEVLGVADVGIDDSFFELGGHSLLATRLVSRIRSTLGVEVEIRALFDAPTVAELALRLGGVGQGARVGVGAWVRPGRVPVSFAQRRLWFLGQLDGPSATYNIPMAMRLHGRVEVEALQAALGDVAGRHESLRTVFHQAEDGQPYQHILSPADTQLAFSVTETDEAGLEAALRAEAATGFDLARDIPVRARLFVLGPDEYVLMLVVHHIAADGWSMAPLARDLSTAYAARVSGGAPAWEDLPVQYADYALWQQEVLGSEDDPDSVITAQLGYWTQTLAGLPEQLELPTDRPRPAVASHDGDTVTLRIPADLHEQLLKLSHQHGTSLFMTTQAALAVLLTRMGAGTDIPIGTPVAGRTDEALDDLIGFFVNNLVLRTDTSGDPSFVELLERVRERDLEAFAHQDVPFERLVEVINPERSMSRHPLFQVMLSFQNNTQPDLDLPGLAVSPEGLRGAVARFDLTVNLGELHTTEGQPNGLAGRIDYRTDLFDRQTIEALAVRLNRILKAVVTAPEAPVSSIDILEPVERHRLVSGWNDTVREVPAVVVSELFEAQV